jgi:hypothetical protein
MMYGSWEHEQELIAMERMTHVATESEAHAEWHANTGRLYGCPQDACHPPEPPEETVEVLVTDETAKWLVDQLIAGGFDKVLSGAEIIDAVRWALESKQRAEAKETALDDGDLPF